MNQTVNTCGGRIESKTNALNNPFLLAKKKKKIWMRKPHEIYEWENFEFKSKNTLPHYEHMAAFKKEISKHTKHQILICKRYISEGV